MRGQTGELPPGVYVLLALAWVGPCRAQHAIAAGATVVCTADPHLPAFEVAAITPVAEKDRGFTDIGAYGLPHFTLRNVSLSVLLGLSFDIQPANFINAPHGLDNAVFDIRVEAADGIPLTYEAIKPRMQQLLEQRFCLKAHTGTKQVAGYALLKAKSGAKLTPESTPGERGSAYILEHEINGTSIDMLTLAAMLASPAGRPVQDQTGLQGEYNIKIQFSRASDAESALPSIFTAVKEQIGWSLSLHRFLFRLSPSIT